MDKEAITFRRKRYLWGTHAPDIRPVTIRRKAQVLTGETPVIPAAITMTGDELSMANRVPIPFNIDRCGHSFEKQSPAGNAHLLNKRSSQGNPLRFCELSTLPPEQKAPTTTSPKAMLEAIIFSTTAGGKISTLSPEHQAEGREHMGPIERCGIGVVVIDFDVVQSRVSVSNTSEHQHFGVLLYE
ncbi:MAG: hypothetical protein Q9227_000119 [Pyrenula ochraceoflavens]